MTRPANYDGQLTLNQTRTMTAVSVYLHRHWSCGRKFMLHSVVVVNTGSTSFRVGNSIWFTCWLVFTTLKLFAFTSMTIIPTSQPWPLQWRL